MLITAGNTTNLAKTVYSYIFISFLSKFIIWMVLQSVYGVKNVLIFLN